MKIRKIAQTPGLVATVVDNLISTSKVDALSANQGKILNEKVNTGFSYSTNETLTGETWIDGKPLYRKVFYMSGTTSGEKSIDISSLNYEFIMIKNQCLKSRNFIFTNNRYNVNTPDDVIEYFIANNTKQLKINIGTPWANFETYIVVEYTKTTD